MTDTRVPAPALGCYLYLRLSDLKADDLNEDGKGKTFAAREKKLRERAAQLGWPVAGVVVENDVVSKDGRHRNASAFKRKKKLMPDGTEVWRVWRPGFQSILEGLRAGVAKGLIAEDLDRAMRDPRDLEDLIDVAEEHKISAQSLSGSLTFTHGGTDSEITMARVMVALANKFSRDMRRRVAASRERKALAGEFGGGIRPFGFNVNGLTLRPDVVRTVTRDGVEVEQTEADVIAEHTRRIIKCDGAADADTAKKRQAALRALAAELRADGVLTVTGKPMNARTWRGILLRDRNAGWFMHRGERLGQLLPEIVTEDELDEVRRILTDPARRTGPGGSARWLGSGLYRCGACDDGTGVEVSQGHAKIKKISETGEEVVDRVRRSPRYRCKQKNHLARQVALVDQAVETAVLALIMEMQSTGGWALLNPQKGVDTAALRTERTGLRERLERMTEDSLLGLLDRDAVIKATRTAKTRLQEIEELLAAAHQNDRPLARLVQAENIPAVWDEFGLGEKRAVLDDLVTVTLMPTGKSGNRFNPDTIRIEPKEGSQTSAA